MLSHFQERPSPAGGRPFSAQKPALAASNGHTLLPLKQRTLSERLGSLNLSCFPATAQIPTGIMRCGGR